MKGDRMIYLRNAKKDDRKIFQIIKHELYVFTKQNFPDFKLTWDDVKNRLRHTTTYVLKPNRTAECKGFISYFIRGNDLWIDMLAIEREYSGRGWGKMLLSKAEAAGKAEQCSKVLLYVDQINPKAQQFYVKRGYRPASYEPKLKCHLFMKEI